jgi:hypothetical protein
VLFSRNLKGFSSSRDADLDQGLGVQIGMHPHMVIKNINLMECVMVEINEMDLEAISGGWSSNFLKKYKVVISNSNMSNIVIKDNH